MDYTAHFFLLQNACLYHHIGVQSTTVSHKILVVDDEQSITDLLEYNLRRNGYRVVVAHDGRQALRREEAVPIIMLTARDEEVDRVVGLELGADDYVTKPFSVRELMARVKAVLRRVGSGGVGVADVLRAGPLEIDVLSREVRLAGAGLPLTQLEFDLLETLARHAGQVLSRQQLLDQVWGYDYYGDSRAVDRVDFAKNSLNPWVDFFTPNIWEAALNQPSHLGVSSRDFYGTPRGFFLPLPSPCVILRAMIKRALLYIAVFACLLFLLLGYIEQQSVTVPPPLNRVAAWMPSSWDAARARASWETNHAHIQELSPVWYQLAPGGDGSILPYSGARDGGLVEEAHAQSTLVVPLINNCYADAGFDPAPVSAMLHDPARRAAHVNALVNETLTYNYDGVDVDYESLNGLADRDAFSLFVEELAAALHAHGKLLSVTVHPKTDEPGSWEGPQAQDWTRVGAAADRFRVMTYGYHWPTSDPGPIAPLWWMEDVMDFAVSVVPPNRIYLGIHFYGHDWAGGTSSNLTWESARALMTTHGAIPQWKTASGWGRAVSEPWFTYTDDAGRAHEVWYADEASISARLRLVEQYGLGGVAVWRLGGEDQANWSAIGDVLHSADQQE